jgi:hypothetical protein
VVPRGLGHFTLVQAVRHGNSVRPKPTFIDLHCAFCKAIGSDGRW